MDASPLAKLPQELRGQICIAYFEQNAILHIDIVDERPSVKNHDRILAISRTCRQIHLGSTHIFKLTKPSARYVFETDALTKSISCIDDYMLANAALPIFSGDSYTCSYAAGCVEIHLGEIDLTISQASLEYLDHFRIMCNTPVVRKLMSLACP